MTSLRFLVVLLTLAALMLTETRVQAANIRRAVQDSADSSDSSDHSSDHSPDDATQDSAHSGASASSGSEQNRNVIETQSRVADPSAPAVGETGGVRAWAQCGGLYYLGETKCQPLTFCKQLSEFISVCFPESRPTENVIRLEL
ncbi:hypothetical protein PHYPSEUDO_001842 [Phytophthora pseudosyringae]|uniref:CBM1 domain-containing protein n=1 Tax=Phytophthora pseudosyringae TaxID=221518 RepID=A0A8T1VYT7_9STRA|nr:hypothetical protein PHYPSEUDO_001842 [Phytophthora pseudosyringae]